MVTSGSKMEQGSSPDEGVDVHNIASVSAATLSATVASVSLHAAPALLVEGMFLSRLHADGKTGGVDADLDADAAQLQVRLLTPFLPPEKLDLMDDFSISSAAPGSLIASRGLDADLYVPPVGLPSARPPVGADDTAGTSASGNGGVIGLKGNLGKKNKGKGKAIDQEVGFAQDLMQGMPRVEIRTGKVADSPADAATPFRSAKGKRGKAAVDKAIGAAAGRGVAGAGVGLKKRAAPREVGLGAAGIGGNIHIQGLPESSYLHHSSSDTFAQLLRSPGGDGRGQTSAAVARRPRRSRPQATSSGKMAAIGAGGRGRYRSIGGNGGGGGDYGAGIRDLSAGSLGTFSPDSPRLAFTRGRGGGPDEDVYGDDASGRPRKRKHWVHNLFRPSHGTVEVWLNSWWKRWGILAVAPSCIVWFWCAFPFPKSDPYDPNGPWCSVPNPPPWCSVDRNPSHGTYDMSPSSLSTSRNSTPAAYFALSASSSHRIGSIARNIPSLSYTLYTWFVEPTKAGMDPTGTNPAPPPTSQVDANFWFFLIFYYGMYCAVGLIYVTQLFSLYRLNWWPAALGARTSYTFFWLASLLLGWALHEFDPLGSEQRRHDRVGGSGRNGDSPSPLPSPTPVPGPGHGGPWWDGDLADEVQWQRKTMWVALAFATMAMPALVCFAGIRRSGRQTYRHSLTDLQKTFLERQLVRRIPSSYIRFLWFMLVIGFALFGLVAGQGYASVYLSTLPHTSIEGTAYVTFWALTVNVLAIASHWMLEEKIRSRALVFVFKYYYFLVYFIFYRNLFARLRSFDQFALIQLLSSFWVCIWYPFSMSSFAYRTVEFFNPHPKSWEEYVEGVGLAFYLRNLAQNATMLAFLGWVSILHFGPNQQLYPFFAFDDKRDPYNYQLTMLGASAIWGSELLSSYVAREICKYTFGVDVTNLGLDEMRQYPEIVPTCLWTSVHVLMDMLLFLIKLNFK